MPAKRQWSIRKTRTVETLASEADVWVQAPKALLRGSGISSSEKNCEIVYMQNSAM